MSPEETGHTVSPGTRHMLSLAVYLLCSAVTFAHLTPVLGNFQLSLVWV